MFYAYQLRLDSCSTAGNSNSILHSSPSNAVASAASIAVAFSPRRHGSFFLPFGGLVLAVAGILAFAEYRNSEFAVVLFLISLAGLLLNGYGIGRAIGCTERCRTSAPALRQCHGLMADMASIAVLLSTLGLCSQLQIKTSLLAMTAYVVILLCAMIKASALKKSGRAKWLPAGWIARAVVALMMIEPLLNTFAVAALVPLVEIDLIEIVVCGAIFVGAMMRAFWAGARLAGRDPRPLPAPALIAPVQSYAEG